MSMLIDATQRIKPGVNPVTWIGAGLLLALVVLVVGLWPAERAARIQPTDALHRE